MTKIKNEDKLVVRANSAELAYSLYKYYLENKLEIPKVILEWKEICKSELLPEVHKVWINYDL